MGLVGARAPPEGEERDKTSLLGRAVISFIFFEEAGKMCS